MVPPVDTAELNAIWSALVFDRFAEPLTSEGTDTVLRYCSKLVFGYSYARHHSGHGRKSITVISITLSD